MKKLAILFLFLTSAAVVTASSFSSVQLKKQAFLQEQTYLGPINPGNADNY